MRGGLSSIGVGGSTPPGMPFGNMEDWQSGLMHSLGKREG